MTTCMNHNDLVDAVSSNKYAMQRIEESIEKQGSAINTINLSLDEIKTSLVGTIDKQGFIGKVNSTMQKQDSCLDDLISWRSDMQGMIRSLSIKLVSVVVGFVTVGAVVAIAVIKWMVG